MLAELKQVLKHTAIYGFGNVLSKAVGFFMIPLYTHYLKPNDYGVLELIDLTITVTAIFVGMGIRASILRFYYQYEGSLDRNEVISTALIFVGIVASVVVALAVLNAPRISKIVLKSSEFSNYFAWMFISFLFSTIASVPEAHIMAQQRSTLFTGITIGTLILNLSLNILVVAYLKMGVLGIVYVSAFCRAMNTCLLLSLTLPRVGLRFALNKLKEMLAYGMPLLPANIGLFVVNFSDRFFLSHLSSLSSVGIYSLGYKFGYMTEFFLIHPFNRIWQAQLFELAKKEDAHTIMGRLFTYFTFIVIFGVVALSVLSKDVIKMVSAEPFWPAHRVVPLIAMSCFCRGAYLFFQAGILIEKKTKLVGYSVTIATIANVIFNYYLIKHMAFIGAGVSALITSVIMASFVYYFSTPLFRIDYELKRILKLIVIGFSIGWIAYSINPKSIPISLLIKSAIVMLFPVMLIPIGFYTAEEKTKIYSIMRNAGKRVGSLRLFVNDIH